MFNILFGVTRLNGDGLRNLKGRFFVARKGGDFLPG